MYPLAHWLYVYLWACSIRIYYRQHRAEPLVFVTSYSVPTCQSQDLVTYAHKVDFPKKARIYA